MNLEGEDVRSRFADGEWIYFLLGIWHLTQDLRGALHERLEGTGLVPGPESDLEEDAERPDAYADFVLGMAVMLLGIDGWFGNQRRQGTPEGPVASPPTQSRPRQLLR
jgi:hypothetical protein